MKRPAKRGVIIFIAIFIKVLQKGLQQHQEVQHQ
jgi:hypothetical protein